MRLSYLPAFCFFFFMTASIAQPDDAKKSAIFPAVSAYNLEKTKVNLPSGFEGKINLVLISFETEQSKKIDSWIPTAQTFQHMNFDFRYYKLPVSSQENAILRWWDNSSLRSVETDPETWHWIVPLYVNKDDFRKSLMIRDEKDIVVALVDQTGRVLWKETGQYTQEKKNALTAAVNAATPSPSGQH